MSTYILWDIDGTLIYNTPSAGALYLDAIEHVTGVRPTVPVPDPHGMTEGQLLVALLEVNGLDTGRLGDVLYDLDVLSREQHERGLVREACAGAPEALVAVKERGWTNALLTGNGPNRARYKLLAAGYDPEDFDWEHSYFGHESPTRHHLTAGARSALAGQRAIIIGDTPNDGLAADSARIPFIAVATGIYSADQLRHTSALVVVDDLSAGLDAVLDAISEVAAPASSEADTAGDAGTPADGAAPTDADTPADGAASTERAGEAGTAEFGEAAGLEEFGENPDVELGVSP